jgi:hypothetical protein
MSSHRNAKLGLAGRHALVLAIESGTTLKAAAALLQGLPNDECQCEHMGYVIKGKVAFRSADGEELFEAGDAYHVGPGHTPILYTGTEVFEFSPTEELGRTMEAVTKNMEQMGAGSS